MLLPFEVPLLFGAMQGAFWEGEDGSSVLLLGVWVSECERDGAVAELD